MQSEKAIPFWALPKRHDVTVEQIRSWNGGTTGRLLQIGQKLTLNKNWDKTVLPAAKGELALAGKKKTCESTSESIRAENRCVGFIRTKPRLRGQNRTRSVHVLSGHPRLLLISKIPVSEVDLTRQFGTHRTEGVLPV